MKPKKRKTVWAVMLILVAAVAAVWWWMTPSRHIPCASCGTLERHESFASHYVSKRTVTVWLPEGYRVGDSCAVIYMHDGQMLFDAATTWNHQEWEVDETLCRMMGAGQVRPCIVVGIDNSEVRLHEYFPSGAAAFLPPSLRNDPKAADPRGDNYLKFVVEEVKPFVDEHYRPLTDRANTFMIGSSMGGLISLYALCQYPDVFGGVACLSSHLSFSHLDRKASQEQWLHAFVEYLNHRLPAANSALVYMDHGTATLDAEYGPCQETVDSVFMAKGWDESHYKSLVFKQQEHSETAWASRLSHPLQFLIGKQAD
ncbi:MAG: hypothetical protein IJ632_05050 [Muribaculaceae bacterium]|nr:hypothetical protein [Muribaculaceae bacterium]